ncbi:MAG: hypothetical protein D3924_13140 [Candidatus Electrothrix sp. AR4]|nr:hypothetical protein [Candidatus Electrothrix sp. AR4]
MTLKQISYMFVALSAAWASNDVALATDTDQQTIFSSSYEDSAVSSLLLAAGMYGGLEQEPSQGVNVSLSQSKNMLKGLFSDQGQFDGQDITLSYNGSSGRLGFSAGYIYTALKENQEAETILLGLDDHGRNTLNNVKERPWYLTFNLSQSFQVSENLAVGVGSKAVLLTNSLYEEENKNQAVSMSLNLPVSYKGFFTITPEVQWSRSLLTEESDNTVNHLDTYDPDEGQNAFYGGMSISFSY